MSLEDKISQDYVQAMKARDSFTSSVLSFLRAQIKNVKVDKRLEAVPDEDVIAVIKKQSKQRLDSIAQFKAGGRADLAEKEEKELVLLKKYLPPEMSTEQLKKIIEEVIAASGAASLKDMGRVMKDVLGRTGGQADNQTVSRLVKERLTGI
ncbi:MAG: GatB/YqeY domain-containing protein [Candidatus Omnitrophica bacterium]|nr:GatB/YqeY domain-containing protein [Candidatus Omnitrophota bacterium]MDE2008906.1 GatB/YqeY domain-containing protein [Candidatus Omnitrophota bacterium]MDE2213531.1 GatB/YqeY domain-containing protein [Candidatus Omnitrophota bacterium]MDE2230568.1 GatB/YqeY domain-containing protein [Candidatus Omnitrophota bacterium]